MYHQTVLDQNEDLSSLFFIHGSEVSPVGISNQDQKDLCVWIMFEYTGENTYICV